MCAEKIRAVSQRARNRDFYDLYFLIEKLKVNFKDSVALFEKKEVRLSIISENISKNWLIAKKQMSRDLGNIYCSELITNQKIERVIRKIQFSPIKKTSWMAFAPFFHLP
jgi:predicted nucleotidyltransferase component of viral defense system